MVTLNLNLAEKLLFLFLDISVIVIPNNLEFHDYTKVMVVSCRGLSEHVEGVLTTGLHGLVSLNNFELFPLMSL